MNNERIYIDIPNAAFYKVIRQYAFDIGRPIFTIRQQHATLMNYTFFAIHRN